MAVAVLERFDENNFANVMKPARRLDRRHYKKDSRFVLDLYTLTYDEHESLDSLGDFTARRYDSVKSNINLRNNSRNTTMGYRFRRPSLQSRMQDGKNMQLYFVNEQLSESADNHMEDGILSLPVIPSSNYSDNLEDTDLTSLPIRTINESEMCHRLVAGQSFSQINDSSDDNNNRNYNPFDTVDKKSGEEANINGISKNHRSPITRNDVCTSLRSVCEEAKRKLDVENRQRSDSPITCTIKTSLKKVGAETRNTYGKKQRMNRHMLTKMNVRQLQGIINDLHPHVEYLNEQLMKMLMERDELHMKRDSLLVDIEDMTAYLDPKLIISKENDMKFNQLNENKNNVQNGARELSPNSYTRSLISGLRFNRFTSYVKN